MKISRKETYLNALDIPYQIGYQVLAVENFGDMIGEVGVYKKLIKTSQFWEEIGPISLSKNQRKREEGLGCVFFPMENGKIDDNFLLN